MTHLLQIPSSEFKKSFVEVISVETVKGRNVTLRLLADTSFVPDLSQITSASVIPFIETGKIVATILERGIDIPGGHVEDSDTDVVDTIMREAYEEAFITLAEPLYLIGVIESDYTPEQTTYMLIAAGRVDATDDFASNFESLDREVVTISEFMNRYTAGPHDMMDELLSRAEALSELLLK